MKCPWLNFGDAAVRNPYVQRREVVWMNYNPDGQMDFSDFPEILPKEGAEKE